MLFLENQPDSINACDREIIIELLWLVKMLQRGKEYSQREARGWGRDSAGRKKKVTSSLILRSEEQLSMQCASPHKS